MFFPFFNFFRNLSMFKYLLWASTFLLCLNGGVARAEEDFESQPQKSASKQIEENYNNWKNKVSVKLLDNCKAQNIDIYAPQCDFSSNMAYGDAIVPIPADNYKWVDARSLAYTEALVNAYTKVAQEQSTSNQVETIKELIDDQTPLETDALKVKSQAEALWNKILALTGGILDKKLEEVGINPEQYNAASEEKKKTLLKNAITVKSTTKALADTSGLVPVQTFEGNDGNGNYAVRVVVAKSPKRIALVKSMLKNGSNIPPIPNKKSSKTIEQQVVVPEDVLFNQFGVRLIYDPEGYPVLVAFGQAGVANSGSEAMKAIKLESARSLAKTNARNALTNLLRSSTVFKSVVSQVSNSSSEMRLIAGNDGITEEMIENVDVTNSLNEKSTTKSQISNFAGIRELHSWSYTHPKLGHEVVGVILMWSPKTADYAKGMKSATSPTNNNTVDNYNPENAGVQRGLELDDYDF